MTSAKERALAASRAEGRKPHTSTGMLVPGAQGVPPCGSTGGCCGSGGTSPWAGRSWCACFGVGQLDLGCASGFCARLVVRLEN